MNNELRQLLDKIQMDEGYAFDRFNGKTGKYDLQCVAIILTSAASDILCKAIGGVVGGGHDVAWLDRSDPTYKVAADRLHTILIRVGQLGFAWMVQNDPCIDWEPNGDLTNATSVEALCGESWISFTVPASQRDKWVELIGGWVRQAKGEVDSQGHAGV